MYSERRRVGSLVESPMTIAAAPDAELAAAAKLGDKEAFSGLYERYFDRVFDFLSRMTRNRELAADLTQDTFVRAMQKIEQLEEPSGFRGWLYAIARTQALNRIEREKRSTPTDPQPDADESPGPLLTELDHDRLGDPEEVARTEDVAELVWAAAESLDERTYTVLDLSVRQELSSAEIADVMGVSKGNASVMVNRMKERAGAAIGTVLIARHGARSCPELRAIVGTDPGISLDETTKKKVERHVAGCEQCSETKKRIAAPQQVMAAYATTPPPEGLRQGVWDEIDQRWAAEGPNPASGWNLARIGATAGFFGLFVLMGVLGAVQVVEPEDDPDFVAVESAIATTSTSTTTSTSLGTTSTSRVTTTTDDPVTTSPPTTVVGESPPTVGSPPPPPPNTTTTSTIPDPRTTTTIIDRTTTTTLPPNESPVVTIVRPEGRVGVDRADPQIEAEATVDDEESGLVLEWTTSVTGDRIVRGNPVTLSLPIRCPTSEEVTITATATDSSNLIGEDKVTITVFC